MDGHWTIIRENLIPDKIKSIRPINMAIIWHQRPPRVWATVLLSMSMKETVSLATMCVAWVGNPSFALYIGFSKLAQREKAPNKTKSQQTRAKAEREGAEREKERKRKKTKTSKKAVILQSTYEAGELERWWRAGKEKFFSFFFSVK